MDDQPSNNGSNSDQCFIHTIRVGWADCDPARIVYTGRLPAFALEAIDAWWETRVGAGWFEMNIDRNVGSPFVHLSLDFLAPVTPRHRLQCEVALIGLGETSVRFHVTGTQNSVVCFQGNFVEVFIDAARFVKAPPPADIRAKIEPFLVTDETRRER